MDLNGNKLVVKLFHQYINKQNTIQYREFVFIGNQERNVKKLLLEYQEQYNSDENISTSVKNALNTAFECDFTKLIRYNESAHAVIDDDADLSHSGSDRSGGGHADSGSDRSGGGGNAEDVAFLKNILSKKTKTPTPSTSSFIPFSGGADDDDYQVKNGKIEKPSKIFFIFDSIYPDDSIDTIQKKITATIGLADNHYFLPEYQYICSTGHVTSRTTVTSRATATSHATSRATATGISHQVFVGELEINLQDGLVLPNNSTIFQTRYFTLEKLINCNTNSVSLIIKDLMSRIQLPFDVLKTLFPYCTTIKELIENHDVNRHRERELYDTYTEETRLERVIHTIDETLQAHKVYKNIEKSFNENVIQLIIKTAIDPNDIFDIYSIFQNIRLSSDLPYARVTLNGGTSYSKHLEVTDPLLIQRWENNVAPSRSLILRMKVVDHDRYYNIIIRNTNENSLEIQMRFAFDRTMNVSIEDILPKHVGRIVEIFRVIEKDTHSKIIHKNFHENLNIYNIHAEITYTLDKKKFVQPQHLQKLSKILYLYYQHFNSEVPILLYKRINNYEQKKEEQINEFIQQYIVQIGSKPSNENLEQIANTTGMDFDKIKDLYGKNVNYMKVHADKFDSDKGTVLEYKPPGVVMKFNENRILFNGVSSMTEYTRLRRHIGSLLTLYSVLFLNSSNSDDIFSSILTLIEKVNKKLDISRDINSVIDKDQGENTDTKLMRRLGKNDPARMKFKTPSSIDGYSRLCQKAKPDFVLDKDASAKFTEMGYRYDNNIGGYVYNEDQLIVAIPLVSSRDDQIYHYYCTDPEYRYPGLISPDKNPHKLAMPCCYKKPQIDSNVSKKKDVFVKYSGLKLVGNKTDAPNETQNESQLYIYMDRPFVNINRMSVLPSTIDKLLNRLGSKTYRTKEKQDILIQTDGYFFKKGVPLEVSANTNQLLNALIGIFHISSVNELINHLKSKMKDYNIFKYVSNGDDYLRFGRNINLFQESFDARIKDYHFVLSLVCAPNVFHPLGLNLVMFTNSSKTPERFNTRHIVTNNFADKERQTIMLIHDLSSGKELVYPICYIIKNRIDSDLFTEISIHRDIDHIVPLFKREMSSFLHKMTNVIFTSPRELVNYFQKEKVKVIGQTLNEFMKVNFIIIENPSDSRPIPIPCDELSGYLYDFPILEQIPKIKLSPSLEKFLNISSVNVEEGRIVSVRINNGTTLLVDETSSTYQHNYPINSHHNDSFDPNQEIILNNKIVVDPVVKFNNEYEYSEYAYNHFKLHWYYFFTQNKAGKSLRSKIINLLKESGKNKEIAKLIETNVILLKFEKNKDSFEFGSNSFINYCPKMDITAQCEQTPLCRKVGKECALSIHEKFQHLFLKKMIDEIIHNGLSSDEILGLNGAFVGSFLGDAYKFTHNPGEVLLSNITNGLNDFSTLNVSMDEEIILREIANDTNKSVYSLVLSQNVLYVAIAISIVSYLKRNVMYERNSILTLSRVLCGIIKKKMYSVDIVPLSYLENMNVFPIHPNRMKNIMKYELETLATLRFFKSIVIYDMDNRILSEYHCESEINLNIAIRMNIENQQLLAVDIVV